MKVGSNDVWDCKVGGCGAREIAYIHMIHTALRFHCC